jgi:hypothetical protein
LHPRPVEWQHRSQPKIYVETINLSNFYLQLSSTRNQGDNAVDDQEEQKREPTDVEITLSAEQTHMNNGIIFQSAASLQGNVGITVLSHLTNGI